MLGTPRSFPGLVWDCRTVVGVFCISWLLQVFLYSSIKFSHVTPAAKSSPWVFPMDWGFLPHLIVPFQFQFVVSRQTGRWEWHTENSGCSGLLKDFISGQHQDLESSSLQSHNKDPCSWFSGIFLDPGLLLFPSCSIQLLLSSGIVSNVWRKKYRSSFALGLSWCPQVGMKDWKIQRPLHWNLGHWGTDAQDLDDPCASLESGNSLILYLPVPQENHKKLCGFWENYFAPLSQFSGFASPVSSEEF